MGARGVGHIAHLMDIASPTIGAALNVGSAHVGEFGDADAIARAKSEIVATLPATGVAVLNADDVRVRAMRAVTSARVLTFGEADDADVRVSDLTLDSMGRPRFVLTFQGISHPVRLQYSGAHNASNAAAAAAIAIAAGVEPEAAFNALDRAQPTSRWRMEITTSPRGVVVVNDAYNANPESVAAALRAVAAMDRHGHAWAVLGEMRELGDVSHAAHREVGRQAAEMRFDRLVAVGASPDVGAVADGALAAGFAPEFLTRVTDPEAAADVLLRECAHGDVVLLKASRAIGLEVAAERLLQAGGVA
jgi:UDP-N-acetylmuramoyl-tripeptide--D-alanyl-D-alanine ligase